MEPRRSMRLERSRAAAAAPPPARRTTRAEGPVHPRKREHSVSAARVARSPRLLHGERDPEDVAAAAPPPPKRSRSLPACSDQGPTDVTVAPPPAPRDEAPVPLPNQPRPRTAYALRNRLVPDTSNREPYVPARYKEREELEHDRSCSSRKKLKQDELSEAPACARVALELYNSMNQGGEHELVKAVGVHSFLYCGMWLHANFLARRKGANNCVDLVPKYFFAELSLDGFGLLCASCVKMDSVESKNLGGCGVCPGQIMHPSDVSYLGAQARREPAAAGGLEVAFSF